MTLRFTEEIVLLALHDSSGEFAAVKDWPLRCALAGGVLMDLLLEGRLAAEPKSLRVLDAAPLDEPLLDPALAEMAADEQTRTPRHWVDHFARQADRLRAEALESLVAHGILRHESGLFQWARGARRYPTAMEEVEVKLRILGVLLEDEEPTPRDIALIHLAHACHILRPFLKYELYRRAAKRIEEVCHLDEAGAAVLDAVMDSEVASGPSHGEPAYKVLPVIGDFQLLLGGDSAHWFLSDRYLELGPVYRMHAFGKDATVLSGPEANRFLMKHGKGHLRSFEEWREFGPNLGASRNLLNMDGPDHKRLREVIGGQINRRAGLARTADMVGVVRRRLDAWLTAPKPLPVLRTMARLLIELADETILDFSSRDYTDDLIDYIDLASVQVRKPDVAKTEKFQKLRGRMLEMCAGIAERHRGRDAAPQCIGHRLVALHEEDPAFLPEADLPALLVEMYFASYDLTSATLSFMLHALFEDEELMARATAEADALFADGMPTAQAFEKLDVLPRLMLEALRLYPPLFSLGRTVTNTFDFGGFRIPHGEKVVFATSVPHALPEFYPEPQRFDIDRYLPGRMEHAAPGAYAPFGAGAHACLGSGMARVLVPVALATMLHGAEVEEAGEFKYRHLPIIRPTEHFTFRVRARRTA